MTGLQTKEIIMLLVTVLGTVLASSGFWLYMTNRREKKDVKTEVLIGLAHDRIIYLGLKYLKIGSISQDEFENLHDYLYMPYLKMGGNGCAKKIMEDVKKLPIYVEKRCLPKKETK